MSTARSNRKQHFLFTAANGRVHLDTLHGGGINAWGLLFNRVVTALTDFGREATTRSVTDNDDGSQTIEVFRRGNPELVIAITATPVDGKL